MSVLKKAAAAVLTRLPLQPECAQALVHAHFHGVDDLVESHMPGLARLGLAEGWVEDGRWVWRLTPAGRRKAGQLRYIAFEEYVKRRHDAAGDRPDNRPSHRLSAPCGRAVGCQARSGSLKFGKSPKLSAASTRSRHVIQSK